MATYKKRGYKPKTKADRLEALEEQSKTAEVFKSLDEGASKTEQWVIKNQKIIFSIIGLVAVVVLGYLGYSRFIQEPKEIEAKNDMFQAQQYFDQAVNAVEKDSLFNLALNGGEGQFGMLDIIANHGSTDAGNLANYYAGMSYFNLKDYENAIRYLSDFKSDDDVLGPLAMGGIGDCFIQLNQPEDALEYYEKAAKMKTNNFSTPIYLFKAGTTALNLDRPTEALEFFRRIKNEFPESTQAANIDVFIGRAEAAAN